jgi:hypothetical protein
MQGAAQIALLPEALHLGSVVSSPLERDEAQSPAGIEPSQPSSDPRTDAAACVVEDRQAHIRSRVPLFDHGRSIGARAVTARTTLRPRRVRAAARAGGTGVPWGRLPWRTMLEQDGSIRIAWQADGFEAIVVRARFRPAAHVEDLARGVADIALLERTLAALRVALQQRFPGAFDLLTERSGSQPGRVIVRFHPPRGEPNPDPW